MRAAGNVQAIAYSPDGKTVISVATVPGVPRDILALQLWNAATGQLRREFMLNVDISDTYARLPLLSNGTLFVLDRDAFCHAIEVQTGKASWKTKLSEPDGLHFEDAGQVSLAPNGTIMAVRWSSDQVVLFDLPTGKETIRIILKRTPDRSSADHGMAFAPDGETLAIATEENRIDIFDVATGKKMPARRKRLGLLDHLNFSPDGRNLYCGGVGCLILRDWKKTRTIVSLTRPSDASFLGSVSAFSPDGQLLAVNDSYGGAHIYDVATAKHVHRLPAGQVSFLAFSSDGRTLLSCDSAGAMMQWDVTTAKPRLPSGDPIGALRVLRFAGEGKHLIACTERHWICKWHDGQSLSPCAKAELPQIYGSSCLSPDGKLLAEETGRGESRLVDAKSGEELHSLGHGRFNQHLFAGQLLFVATGDLVSAWHLTTLKVLTSFKHPARTWISKLAVSLDAKSLAVVGSDGRTSDREVWLWDVTSGKMLHHLKDRSIQALAFSADGRTLAVASGETLTQVHMIDVRSGGTTSVISSNGVDIRELAFSRDGRMLATGDCRGALRLWELATGGERHCFEGHRNAITGLAFTESTAILAASSREAPAYVWDVYGKHAPSPHSPQKWSVTEQDSLWKELAGNNSEVAFQAIRGLVRNPGTGVALVHERLKPAETVDNGRLQQLLQNLTSDEFEVRQAAFVELEILGDRIEPLLNKAPVSAPDLEAKRRIQLLLDRIGSPNSERLARWRAVEALEQIATLEAVQLLKALGAGVPSARQTQDAQASLARLGPNPGR